MFTLEKITGLFVPSTYGIETVSKVEFDNRILETAEILAVKFGGCHILPNGFGLYVSFTNGEIISGKKHLD